MATTVKDVRSILNDLIQTCKDGQQGFLDAAHHVQDPGLKALFLEYSQQRSMFAGDLQREVMSLGGEPEHSGSTMGALHRGWIDFKAKVTGQKDAAILHEAESGEDAAKKAYESALKESLPTNLRDVVEEQYNAIRRAHNQVRSLELHTKDTRSSGGAA